MSERDAHQRRQNAVDEITALLARVSGAQANAMTGELAALRAAVESATRSLDAALLAAPQPEAEVASLVERFVPDVDVDALQESLREREEENERLRAMLVKARMDLEAARADLDATQAALEAERVQTETIRSDAAALTDTFDRTIDELRREHAAAMAEQTAASTVLPLDELLTEVGSLSRASSAAELLSTLGASFAREFSRVALFHVEGTRLMAAERQGFSAGDDPARPLRLSADSLLARALTSGRIERVVTSTPGEPHPQLPFGGTPSCALAVPLAFQGRIVALFYIDDSDRPEFVAEAAQARMRFAELLQQYATLVLLRISVEQRTADDLRALAGSLVAELESAYTVDAEAGRNRLACQQALKEGLQAARRRYSARAEGDAQAAGLLEEALAAAAATQRDSAFGRDLAPLLGAPPRPSRGGNIVTMFR